MTKEIIIIALLLLVLYLHYQRPNTNLNSKSSPDYQELDNKYQEVIKVNKVFAAFCKDEIGGQDIAEIRTKLNGKKLSQILEENEDYELEIDTLRRSKGELETDLLSQSNSFKSLLGEKEGIIKRLENDKKQTQKDLTNLNELSKIQTQKVSDLEKAIKKSNSKAEELKLKDQKINSLENSLLNLAKAKKLTQSQLKKELAKLQSEINILKGPSVSIETTLSEVEPDPVTIESEPTLVSQPVEIYQSESVDISDIITVSDSEPLSTPTVSRARSRSPQPKDKK